MKTGLSDAVLTVIYTIIGDFSIHQRYLLKLSPIENNGKKHAFPFDAPVDILNTRALFSGNQVFKATDFQIADNSRGETNTETLESIVWRSKQCANSIEEVN